MTIPENFFPADLRPCALIQSPSLTARAVPPQIFYLLLTCARIGLDAGPILSPEHRALDLLLTEMKGPQP